MIKKAWDNIKSENIDNMLKRCEQWPCDISWSGQALTLAVTGPGRSLYRNHDKELFEVEATEAGIVLSVKEYSGTLEDFLLKGFFNDY